MDDHSELTREPTPPSLRERLHANRLLRGGGNAAVAVNGLLGQPPATDPAAR